MFQFTTKVRYSEVDPQGRLTTPAMINLLQDCATFHSEATDFNVEYMTSQGLGWYIASWQIIYEGPAPKLNEQITVSTWPYKFRGMMGLRNLTLAREDGSIYAKVNSIWILMDLKTGVPSRVSQEMADAFGLEPELEAEWPNRKIRIRENLNEIYSFTVSKLHLDTNGHMNNAHYISAASACLPEETEVKVLCTEYKKEAREGDLVIVKASIDEDGVQVVLYGEDDEAYCTVMFTI